MDYREDPNPFCRNCNELGKQVDHERSAHATAVVQITQLREALAEIIDVQGVDHEDEDCPEDDTCHCSNIARVNAAFRADAGRTLLAAADALAVAVATYQEAYVAAAGPNPPDPVDWARGVTDADAEMTQALRAYRKLRPCAK